MKQIFLLGACVLFFNAVSAQVSLDECQTMARENYPLIKQYDLIAQSTAYSVSNAKRTWLPQVALTAQATYQSDVMEFPAAMTTLFAGMGTTLQGLNKDQYKIALEVNQTLWDGGQSASQRSVAESEGAVSKQSLEVEMYALRERVNALYFGILLLDEQQAQIRLAREVLESNQKKLQGLIQNGVAMAGDMDAISVEILSNNQKLTQIETARQAYVKMLALFVGKASLTEEKFIKPKAQTLVGKQINRLELQLFDAQKQGLSAQKGMINSTVQPRLGAFAQGFYGNPGLNVFKDMADNKWSLNYMVGLKFQWNFGGYYTQRNSIQKLDNAQKQIDLKQDVFLFNTQMQLTQQQVAIEKMRRLIEDDDQIIALRTSIRKTAEQKLSNGVQDINDLLREMNAENIAKLERSAHEIEMLQKQYDFKNTVNE